VSKLHRTSLAIFLILIQTLFAIAAGTAAICKESMYNIPSGVDVGGVAVGGMRYDAASAKIDAAYTDKLRDSSIQLQTEDGTVYKVPFSQIYAHINTDAIIRSVKKIGTINKLPTLFNSYFGRSGQNIDPVIDFDEGKLRLALIELSEKLRIEPVNAKINYNNGTIEKTAEYEGIELNIANVVDTIKKTLSEDPWSPIKLIKSKNYELKTILPEIGIKDYDDIQVILSEYETPITDDGLLSGINTAVDSINGVIIDPYEGSGTAGTFSFVDHLSSDGRAISNDDDGYDLVASTLYAALLLSGLPDPKTNITRMSHELAVDYIEPGFDAWISGNGGDLKFNNSFDSKIALFANVEDGYVKVSIAGSMKNKGDYKIRSEVVQKFAPTVYNVENRDLRPGQRIVLSNGRDGMLVEVYRNDELISTDKYEAEKSIVQIGPNTPWDINEGK